MFYHTKQLQYPVRIEKPDPVYAKQLQELIGGQFGEMSVMNQYLFQGWNLRGDLENDQLMRIREILLSTATEEIGHVEMLATCVSMLLEGASPEAQEEAAKSDPVVYAAMGGMNPQHVIVSGLGARPADSVGNPWQGLYVQASGNVIADLYSNVTAEMHGRVQACRMYEMSSDPGVRDMLSFLIARDHLHQMQWLALIEELGGTSSALPIPSTFPLQKEQGDVAYSFINFSLDKDGAGAKLGRFLGGSPAPDGRSEFMDIPAQPMGEAPHLRPAPATEHSAVLGGPVGKEPPVQPPGGKGESLMGQIASSVTGDGR